MKAVISLAQAVKALESGGRPKGGALTGNGIPSLGGEHISASGEFKVDNVKYIPIEYFERIPKAHIKKDDLLLVKDGATTGKLAFVDSMFPHAQAAVNEHVFRIEPNLNIVWPKYLFHYLNSPKGQLQITKNIRGAAIGGINKSILNTIFIPDISIPEQRRIATILDKADAIRRKRQEVLNLVGNLVKSQFIEMFGDPVANPVGWEVGKFKKVILSSPQNGLYVPASKYGHGTRILRIDSFYNGRVNNLNALKEIDIDESTVSKYKLHGEEIVINRVNSRKFLGKSALIPNHDGDIVFESNMMRIQLDKKRVSPGFLIFFLQSDFIKKQILTCCKDAVNQASINQSDVNNFDILLPPLELQEQFARFVEQADKSKVTMQNQLSEIETLSSALKQEFFA